MKITNYKTVEERRKAVEQTLSVRLDSIGSSSLDDTVASNRNCENMIGYTQIPLGVAGPLSMYADTLPKTTQHVVPLATTEGALVASVNRGCKVIQESGGARAQTVHVGTSRGPVFRITSLEEGRRLHAFVTNHKGKLNTIAQSTSGHIQLLDVSFTSVGHYAFIRLTFDTSEAMGMNMVTIATQAIVSFVEKEVGVTCLSLAGNYDVDKKPAWLNIISGRGRKVWAEVTIPSSVIRNVLKTNPQSMYDVWISKCMIGSAISGSLGYNAHFANIIAAFFVATGQDLGHIGECSVGMTTCEITSDNGLFVSIYLPDVMLGTVGGGTGLPTQKEALSIIGAGSTDELARILGCAVLSGEISLLASLSVGTLAQSHEKLARGK